MAWAAMWRVCAMRSLRCLSLSINYLSGLSLQPVFRRGHGSLNKACDRTRIDAAALRGAAGRAPARGRAERCSPRTPRWGNGLTRGLVGGQVRIDAAEHGRGCRASRGSEVVRVALDVGCGIAEGAVRVEPVNVRAVFLCRVAVRA